MDLKAKGCSLVLACAFMVGISRSMVQWCLNHWNKAARVNKQIVYLGQDVTGDEKKNTI